MAATKDSADPTENSDKSGLCLKSNQGVKSLHPHISQWLPGDRPLEKSIILGKEDPMVEGRQFPARDTTMNC